MGGDLIARIYLNNAGGYDFPVLILRGTARILAAVTGLLLVYGIIFALEGMTIRIPTTGVRELTTTAVWTIPWLLLFCSGLEDIAVVANKRWAIWLGGILALLFLYYLDHFTSLSLMTKAAAPLVAVGAGMIPCFIRKIRFLFVLTSLAVGVAGAFVLYNFAVTIFSPTTHFATKAIGVLLVAFCVSGLTSGILAILDICSRLAPRRLAT